MSRRTSANIFGKVIAYILTFVLIGVAVVSTVCLFNNDFRKQVKETIGIEETVESSDNSNSTTSDVKDSEEYLLIVEELESQKKATAEAESQLLTIQIEKTELQQNLTKTEEDLAIAENAVLEKTTQIENLTAEKTQLENELAETEAELEQLKNSSGNSAELQARINELESEVAEKTSALETKISELETKTNELETAQAEVLSLTTEKSSLETQLVEKQTTINSLNIQIETLNARIIELEEQIANAGSGTIGEYAVRVIDYDGSIIDKQYLNTGDVYTLPEEPTHEGLIFQEYTSVTPIKNNTVVVEDFNVDIGCSYKTASGLSEFDIEVTKETGLSITFSMNGTKNWGDGSSDQATTHTYTTYGKYTITCDGTQFTNSSMKSPFNNISVCCSARIGENVTELSYKTFYNSYKLTSVSLPNTITSILTSFGNCYSLKSLTFPKGVVSVGNYAFENCTALESIIISPNLTSVGTQCFHLCSSLKNVVLPDNLESIAGAFNECYSLEAVKLPTNLTNIGSSTFSKNYSLKTIKIPSSVTTIGDYAFENCLSLTSIKMSNSVTTIGNSCFNNCYSLKSIEIPTTLTNIGNNAFNYCYSLLILDFSQFNSIPTTGTYPIQNAKSLKVIVADELYESWITDSNWSSYSTLIYKVSEITA